MDDLFGKPAGKESQSNFMDDILNGGQASSAAGRDKSQQQADFVLDPKYSSKPIHDDKSSVFSG